MRLPTDMEIRRALGKSLAPAMAITGYRFSKRHRQENTIIYRVFDTVGANLTADRLRRNSDA